jgi:hypothetical protein
MPREFVEPNIPEDDPNDPFTALKEEYLVIVRSIRKTPGAQLAKTFGQFREKLEAARASLPNDTRLEQLIQQVNSAMMMVRASVNEAWVLKNCKVANFVGDALEGVGGALGKAGDFISSLPYGGYAPQNGQQQQNNGKPAQATQNSVVSRYFKVSGNTVVWNGNTQATTPEETAILTLARQIGNNPIPLGNPQAAEQALQNASRGFSQQVEKAKATLLQALQQMQAKPQA